MKSRLNRLYKTGLSNQGIATKLNMSISEIKNLNRNDKRFLDLIRSYNKNIADK